MQIIPNNYVLYLIAKDYSLSKNNVAEIEINRLFRSSAYNLVARQSRGKLHIPSDILDVLQGEEPKVARRELSHSPLIHQLLYDECDFRILTLGKNNTTMFLFYRHSFQIIVYVIIYRTH